MPDIAALSVSINADTRQLEAGLSRANQQVSAFGSVLSGLGAGIGIKAFDAITAGMKTAADTAIGFNSKLEQSTIAFTSMLGSAEKAQAFLAEMKQFAATTPFEFPDLLQASKQMMAFGFAAKDVKPLLTAVGSAASAMGTGRSGVDAITKALGQMKAATVVQAGELNQLTEQGVPAFQILADKMGITTGEVKKLASEGKIASDVFIEAFQEWANANYGDMMAKQALTFEGAMSNIKDSLTFATSEALKPFFEVLSAGAVQLSQFVQGDTFGAWAKTVADGARDAFRQIADGVRTVQQVLNDDWMPSDQIEPFAKAVGTAALALKSTLGPAIQAVSGFITGTLAPAVQAVGNFFAEHTEFVIGFATALGSLLAMAAVQAVLAAIGAAIALLASPIGLVTTAITLLVAAWVGNWGGIRDATLQAWAAIEPTFVALVAWLGEKIPPVLTWISETGWPALVTAGQAVGQFITGTLVPAITDLIAWLGPKLQPVVTWLSDTGWPGLQTAMQEVQRIGLLVIQFAKDLWAELEKRGIIDQARTAFDNLLKVLEPVFNVLKLIVGIAAQVLGFFADLAIKGLESGRGVQAVADAIERFFGPLRDGLDTLARFIDMLRGLGNIQMPSWWGSNPFGGGGGGSVGSTFSTMSWRGAGPANPNASQADVEAFAYQAAKARGWSDKDARELVSLISGEGAGQGARALGDSGRSFGPMQLFTGGGLGNEAERAGINLRDPSTWQQQILFGMDTIEREGAGQWSVARNRGLLMSAPVRVPNTQLSPSALGGITMTQATWGTSLAGMTAEEAAAACGPYAAFLFAQATGRNPNPREAEELARLSGWTEAGMGGTGNFMNLLGRMGVRAVRDSTPTEQEAINAGSMVGFSTPKHYFVSQGFDPATGKFNVGATGTYGGGSSWMSYDEIARVGGGIQDIIALAGQMGPAFEAAGSDVLTSVTTLADGSQITISQMGSQIMATVTDSTGQVVASYGTMTTAITEQTAAMTTAVPEQMNLMTSGALVSVSDLGTGIQTVVSEMSGTTIATVTDMAGNVTSQYATLANGVNLTMGDMANGVMTTVTDMGNGMITTMTDANGNMVSTVTDATGRVTNQYTSMAQDAGAATGRLASETKKNFDSIRPPAEAAIEVMEAVGRVKIPAPDVSKVVSAMHKIETAANDAYDAVSSASGKGGHKGGDPDVKNSPFAKRAAGGPVEAGLPYIVGDAGRPELFVPETNGYILPHVPAMSGGGIDEERLARLIASAMPRRGDINVYGAGTEDVTSKLLRRLRTDELMYRIGG